MVWSECQKNNRFSFQLQNKLLYVYIAYEAVNNIKCLTTINFKDKQTVVAGKCDVAEENSQYQWEIVNNEKSAISIRHR